MGFGVPVSSEPGYLFSCFWHISHFDIARRNGDKDLIWYKTFLLSSLGNGDYITSYHRVHIDSANGKGKMFGGMPHGSFGDILKRFNVRSTNFKVNFLCIFPH